MTRFFARLNRSAVLFAVIFACLFTVLPGRLSAAERTVAIKVAQYATGLDFCFTQGGSWSLGDKQGRLTAQAMAQLSGVLTKRAVKRYHVMTASTRLDQPEKLAAALEEWRALGFQPVTMTLGSQLFADDEKTVLSDNRLANVTVGTFNTQAEAQALVDKLASQGKSSWIFTEVVSRSEGRITLSANGQTLAEGAELLLMPEQTIFLKKVEYAAGYSWHGFADRTYRGTMVIRFGAQDAMDCVLTTPLETILAGVVPSEISAKAEIPALQAQAVAARGEILGKVGQRHAGEGFDTCSEQHCQVFAGESALSIDVGRKIAPTNGLLLVEPNGRIVDAVYAANCGGRGEACHFVWSTPANPILGGAWDIDAPPSLDLSEEEQVGVFIKNPPACYCNNPAVEGGNNFRWKKSFAAADWKAVESAVGVGRIKNITDIARGLSGRIYRLTFVGSNGSRTIMKELNIRKLLGGLKSSCFTADWTRDASGFITGGELTGAGFGHGVGMCQTGAQARAKRGWSFDRILAHYFPGSSLKKWY